MTGENTTEQPTPPIEQEESSKVLREIFKQLLESKAQERITSAYANGVNFELTELDIKILFGQRKELPGSKFAIDWRTAVTMAWAEAKLLSYYLRINLAIMEIHNGKIKIPAGLFPAAPTAPADLETNPRARELFEFVQKLHREFLSELENAP